MGSLTNFGETALVKHIFCESAYSPAAQLYLALATDDPGEAATGASMNECADTGSYARKAVAYGAASSRRVTQSGTTTFDTATGAWGTVGYWAIVTSATHGEGNVLAYGAFATPKAVISGNTLSVASGETYVEITASTGLSNYAANGFLDRMFRNQAFTVSGTWMAGATATLSDSTTSPTELSGTDYARVQVNAAGGSSPAWSAVASSEVHNADAITWPAPGGAWGTMTSIFMADASTSGNVLLYDNSISDQVIGVGDTLEYAASAFSFTQS